MKLNRVALLIIIIILISHLNCDDHDEVPRRQHSTDTRRILGGTHVAEGKYKFVVEIQHSHSGRSHHCGGSLLSPKYVLTAAHCLFDKSTLLNPSDFKVVAGSVNRFKGQRQTPREFLPHPEYSDDDQLVNYDIGLIKLKKPFIMSDKITTVQLYTKDWKSLEELNCIAIGWGKTTMMNVREGESSVELVEVALPLISLEKCREKVKVKEGQLCTLYAAGGKDACRGDSGGPLICDDKYQLGVASFGRECALKDEPGVWTDVSKYQKWIFMEMLGASCSKIITSNLFLIVVVIIISLFKLY